MRLETEMEDIDDLLRTTEQPAIVKPKPVNPRAQKDPIEESSEDEFIDSDALTVQGTPFCLSRQASLFRLSTCF